MPLKVSVDDSLIKALGSSELADDVAVSIHGGDCRVCGQPIPAGTAARLVTQRVDAFSLVFVWAQHVYCAGAEPVDASDGLISIAGPGHTYRYKVVIAQHRPSPQQAPETMMVLVLHPHVDGAVIAALPDGSMPTTLLGGYLARGWTPIERTPAPADPAGDPPEGTAAALRGDQLILTLGGSPRPLRLSPHESRALRQVGQLYVAITLHVDPATLSDQQIDALMRSDQIAITRIPVQTTP